MAAKKLSASLDRRGFLGDVLKFGAGAAALSLLPACETLEQSAEPQRGCGIGRSKKSSLKTTRVAQPSELFAPMAVGLVMEQKWRFKGVLRRPDSHLRVQLIDITTGNGLDVEVFRAPDPKKRAIASTDQWEFYTYDGDTVGMRTPEHVKDAINQLAGLVIDNESQSALRNLNGTVCTFAQRKYDEPVPRSPADVIARNPK